MLNNLSAKELEECKYKLVICGGFDPRNSENQDYFNELLEYAVPLDINRYVDFIKSPDEATKCKLLRESTCLLYTPSHEHFGIVPVEAMYAELPVIAVNNGGPTETILDGETGFLVEGEAKKFGEKLLTFVRNGHSVKTNMGAAGKRRVEENFSFASFANKLQGHVQSVLNS